MSNKIVDGVVITLVALLAVAGLVLILSGIWIGGDLLAKMVWSGIISWIVGFAIFMIFVEVVE